MSVLDQSFTDYVVDLMQVAGPVSARRMFGGHGLFLGGVMIAIVFQRTLYFKVDADTEAVFREQGLQPFCYNRRGAMVALSFFEAPEAVFDDLDAMAQWSGAAYAAARRATTAKKPRR